jgi:signal transduction histidine kinase
MDFLPFLSTYPSYFDLPSTVEIFISILLLCLIIIFLWIQKSDVFEFTSNHKKLFSGVFFATILLNFFGGVVFNTQASTITALFSLVFLIVSINYLGPIASLIISTSAGWINGSYTTHSILTILIFAFCGIVLSWAINQNYRSVTFRLLRNPFFSALMVSFQFALLNSVLILVQATTINSALLSNSIAQIPLYTLIFYVPLIMAIGFYEVTKNAFIKFSRPKKELIASPIDKNIQLRIAITYANVSVIFLILISLFGWQIVKKNTIKLFQSEVNSISETVSSNFPLGILFGHDQLDAISQKTDLLTTSSGQLGYLFAEEFRSNSFFQQMYLINLGGEIEGGFPLRNQSGDEIANLESINIPNDIELDISTPQTIYIPPSEDSQTSTIVFLRPVSNQSGIYEKVLIGKTNLEGNLFFLPSLNLVKQLNEKFGTSYLTDAEGNVLYPESEMVYPIIKSSINLWKNVSGNGLATPSIINSIGENHYLVTTIQNENILAYSTPIISQFMALSILLLVFGYLFIRFGLSNILQFIAQFEKDTVRIGEGSLNNALFYNRYDELGSLGKALEKMRISLNSNLRETTNILSISQGVASSVALENTIPQILEGSLAQGGDVARLVLSPEVFGDHNSITKVNFGLPQSPIDYSEFDDILLSLTEAKRTLVLNNPSKSPLKSATKNKPPGAVMSIALMDGKEYLGALWVAYINPHQITKKQTSYLKNIAIQAKNTIINTKKYIDIQRDEKTLNSIFESVQLPMLVTDSKMKALFLNSSASTFFDDQIKVGEIITKEAIPLSLWKKISTNNYSNQSIELKRNRNETFIAHISPISTPSNIKGFITIFNNISELKAINNHKTEMITTVSHGIRNPLLSIQGGATMVRNIGELTEIQKNYIDKIIEETKTANSFVEEILNPARFDQNNGLNNKLFSLTKVVKSVFESYDRQAKSKKISFSTDLPSGEIFIDGDEILIQQAISNLLDNSIKYSENKGKVSIAVSKMGDNVTISIIDEGKGISPIDKQTIFEEIKGKSPTGLLISKSICKLHNGSIEMETKLGKGSTFAITLPISQT